MAHEFKDLEGREWSVRLDIAAARRLREAGHDIVDYEQAGETIADLFNDEIALGEAVYAICRSQADARDVSEESFLSSLNGECVAKAREALFAAMPDFFSGPKRDVITAMLAELHRQLKAETNKAIRKMQAGESLGGELENGQDALDSIPQTSPSGS